MPAPIVEEYRIAATRFMRMACDLSSPAVERAVDHEFALLYARYVSLCSARR